GGRPRGGDEIVTPKNGRSRPEKCGSISHGRVFFCLKPAELKKISRLLIQRRIARRFDQKTKADRATFIDGNTETGVGGCIRTGKSKFEIGDKTRDFVSGSRWVVLVSAGSSASTQRNRASDSGSSGEISVTRAGGGISATVGG